MMKVDGIKVKMVFVAGRSWDVDTDSAKSVKTEIHSKEGWGPLN